jgi:hypothetical protein
MSDVAKQKMLDKFVEKFQKMEQDAIINEAMKKPPLKADVDPIERSMANSAEQDLVSEI